ncbi:MAG TPA: undecaprenyl-diphosphate phosphatase [Candidatus Saccharimonadales bacterium]|nr:undecaprenyl-diphosphate phosphatase [Candidatus Saccharimonadales bacterium]
MLTYLQAIVLGIVQGVTELFPVSSLGHSVLVANLFHWTNLSSQETADSSMFLNLLVMMHVATAIALIIFYRAQWVRIVKGFFRSLQTKDVTHDSDAKLAWLLIAATIPAGLIGLIFEHKLRALFATAFFAIFFIILNGILLLKGDKLVTKAELNRPRRRHGADVDELAASKTARVVSGHLTFGRAALIGVAQIGALFPGISRSGITMLAGLRSGLDHQDAARFTFLLATPIILAAGAYKLPSVHGNWHGAGGPILVGSLLSGIFAYLSVRFLDRYFRNKSLRPFGWYCIGLGVFVLLVSIIRGAGH